MAIIKRVTNWYGRYERRVSSISLFFGFIFDAVTITRIDATWTSVYVLAHVILIGLFIIIIHKKEKGDSDETNPSKAHFWFVNILQFLFGGIFSTFLISYFRSADVFATWPFIVILASAFIANETFKRHYVRLSFQISLYYLSVFSFCIYLLPVLMHQISPYIFILSGLLSLVYILIFIYILFKLVKEKFYKSRMIVYVVITVIFVGVNFLYFTNLIPPIPLSMKDGGIYHNIQRNSDGNYTVQYENTGLKGYFEFYKSFKMVRGEPVYAYSAIFSPSNLNTTIFHEWKHFDEEKQKWTVENTVDLEVIGGRGGGYRTYSVRDNLKPGKWQVNVLTLQGQLVGRLRFKIIPVNIKPELITVVK